ncbi:TPM domain-containing protein [Luteolibacter luteus]|uniref:TPM domain-containing protein n=1 Tax=Luteolibacter luteus TaxID=2728835 RepID=A0A858RLG4_9BACT|nr:TPM domain-containing protein [Luteolibacter luteus]QJE98206.1 TPM domain-containing protein [Luteolibacter luteus]
MRCPYCLTRLTETAVECPKCVLTLDRASALLGAVPRLGRGVCDTTGCLNKAEMQKITKAAGKLAWHFPQVSLNILLHGFPNDHPFSLHVFWIFNCGGFAAENTKGGDNHNILLALDPVQEKSALMVGYGLEPFLGDDAMDHLLELSEPAWRAKSWSKGILEVITGLDRLLEGAALEAAAGFGLNAQAMRSRKGDF